MKHKGSAKKRNSQKLIRARNRQKRIQSLKGSLGRIVRGVLYSLLLLVFGFSGSEGYRYFTTSSDFAVSEVEVEGNRVLERESLIEKGEVQLGKNIFFCDLESIARKITAHPWVKEATVVREFPQKLKILVKERLPIALLKADRYYLIDGEGVNLGGIGDRDNPGLPVIIDREVVSFKRGDLLESDGALIGLELLAMAPRSRYIRERGIHSLEYFDKSKVRLVTMGGKIPIIFDLFELDKGLTKLDTVAQVMKEAPVEGIDLIFDRQVVVRYGKESGSFPDGKESALKG